ncbi:MAG: sigma-54-dependent Fis family transcriptional regulator [Phycisphaerales bacterium]|nr:sigma-54-dependent Fis family transcriptional regulator [Phycisphaerales bacterium]
MSTSVPDLELIPGLVAFVVDRAGVVLGVTRSAAGLWGVGQAELVGTPAGQWLDGIEVLFQGGWMQPVHGAGGGGGAGDVILRALPLLRAVRAASVDVAARSWAGGGGGGGAGGAEAGGGWILSLTDVTGRSAAESELARVRVKLAEAERARAKLQALQEDQAHVGGIGVEEETRELLRARDQYVMVGSSPALKRVKDQVAKVASTSATVLIHGETGAGKELVARSIHALSDRRAQAFVAVNCAAMPESLIESELFGHERGAFTGADKRRAGKFELADGGTLFLDEIAELPLQSQAKLLRVLQDGAFERVGGVDTLRVDVRLVAATHRDLARQVERGRFREDLFYRLNVFKIHVPPLRERVEDLRELAEHLHERIARRMGRGVLPLSERSLRRLMAYSWPGNVRELANAVERATLLADADRLEIEIPESPLKEAGGMGGGFTIGEGAGRSGGGGANGRSGGGGGTRDVLLDLTLEQLQRLHITHALEACGYRVFGEDGAASKLDIHPSTLLSRMDKFGIPRPRQMKRERRGSAGMGG